MQSRLSNSPGKTNSFAFAAFAWALVFALVSTYWALGGEIGLEQLALSIQDKVRDGDTAFAITTWIGAIAKYVWAFLARLMYRWVQRWRRLILVLGWATGVLLTLYGAAGTIEKALMQFDVREVASSIGEDALIWYLLVWDPYWLLGGLLFLGATWRYQQDS